MNIKNFFLIKVSASREADPSLRLGQSFARLLQFLASPHLCLGLTYVSSQAVVGVSSRIAAPNSPKTLVIHFRIKYNFCNNVNQMTKI